MEKFNINKNSFFVRTLGLFVITFIGILICNIDLTVIKMDSFAPQGMRYYSNPITYYPNTISYIIGIILLFIAKVIYDKYFNKVKDCLNINNKIILWYSYLFICIAYFLIYYIAFKRFSYFYYFLEIIDFIVLFILPFFNVLLNAILYSKNKFLKI